MSLIQHGAPDVVVHLGKELGDLVRRLEVSILSQIVESEKALDRLSPLVVFAMGENRRTRVKKWLDEGMEGKNRQLL
jgi:hypothetical protein